jgi:hypothetical protein
MRFARFGILCLLISANVISDVITVEITSPQGRARSHEMVGIAWQSVVAKLPKLTPENARVRDNGGKILVSQVFDTDGNGTPDELLFVADLAGGETRSFQILSDSSLAMPESAVRTMARQVPERKDDYAWENDKVAFRIYGPGLKGSREHENSGIDCLVKRVSYPVLDKWYKGEQAGKSYHVDWGEGYDNYKVGSSLGCGASALWQDGKIVMSGVYATGKSFSSGPLRGSFEVSYGPFTVNGKTITHTRRVTLDLGSRLSRIDETWMVNGKPAKLDLAVGVTTHEGKAEPFESRGRGWLYCWEKIDDSHLGTGILVAPQAIKDYRMIKSNKADEGQAIFIVSTGDDGRITYYSGYGWEKAGEITSREQWQNYLDRFAENLSNPLKIVAK